MSRLEYFLREFEMSWADLDWIGKIQVVLFFIIVNAMGSGLWYLLKLVVQFHN